MYGTFIVVIIAVHCELMNDSLIDMNHQKFGDFEIIVENMFCETLYFQ